jgi:peptidoglycan/xylan/chitin deacetylase (PgdA/CDA1 family)
VSETRVPILMYHSLSEQASPRFQPFTLKPELFAAHLETLNRLGYTTLTVSQLVAAMKNGGLSLPEKSLVITFDDGYADFYAEALPLLNRFGCTATLYLTTGFIGKTAGWFDNQGGSSHLMLDWDQVVEIHSHGIECGGHSHTHPGLDLLSPKASADEVKRCKDILEEKLNFPVFSFAYPYGYYSSRIKQMVKALGYSSACAVNYRISSTNEDPFELSRVIVREGTGIEAFEKLLQVGNTSIDITFRRARSSAWKLARRAAYWWVS